MAIVKCSVCRNEQIASVDTRYCYMDGAKMEPVDAHDCGYQFSRHDKFCPRCGAEIQRIKEQP